MSNEKKNYFVLVMDGDGNAQSSRVIGTEAQVKEHLMSLVEKEISLPDYAGDEVYFRTDCVDEIREYGFGELWAYVSFDKVHVDFIAFPETDPIKL